MTEGQLRRMIERVRCGELPRRDFLQRMASLGLGVPIASLLLADAGIAQPASTPPYKPTRRGGGGPLRVLFWQGPTLLNPHFATGTKEIEGASIFYETLGAWDADGVLRPVLAAEIPSRENGGVAADGRSVVWKLKQGVTWHDGAPFTADDVIFNWQFATDPASAATTSGNYHELKLEKIDTHSVRVVFDKPTPFWPGTYSITRLIPKHLFGPYIGAKSRDAPNNLKPVGTGPYKFVDFRPGDLVRGEINTRYHMPNRPHFDSIELKGGGDATSAARAVLQTGEFDFAWNLLVEDEVLKRMESGGKGRVTFSPGGTFEFIELNYADPVVEVDGERAHAQTRHPIWRDAAVRQAMALVIDRQGIQEFVYGRAGIATANILNNPARFRSPNTRAEFNVDKANAVLDAAGWARGADGVREKDGRKLRFVYQTSINGPRQKVQTIVKQAARKAGIDLELKAVTASVYFGSDVANADTNTKFWADMQMFAFTMRPPDPARFMDRYVSWEFATKANKWQGRNLSRWRSDEYDRLYKAAEVEFDPVKRAALFIRMNDVACADNYILPLIFRPSVAGVANKLVVPLSGWSEDLVSLHSWYRET
ncbi:peptide ABC transporter substrate-binding protein [Aquabacterium sp.]|uniref:peptide ABC transporter substrate-binding protein n=1 Tax=Aquabacterium sp. TaxID=1872578 RepID=UPI002B5BFE77|nr:peptide ABC transporter substrate-binding protein [Aquabacterium sp.]HSW06730.1 peptide ABC transporter substrate-binding protein [Aquabacterium sp.]